MSVLVRRTHRRAALALVALLPAWPALASLTAQVEATRQGVKVALEGTEWPAGATVAFTLRGRPGAPDAFDLGTVRVGSDGVLRATKRTACTTRDPAPPNGTVRIAARSTDGTASAETDVPAAAWRCLGPG
ncbi:MAG: hypothetical protein MUD17_13870 [Gemmatimonadaceae bacterium]|nr:hypothetical protein [Gemmatimonadaceae bacterium]